jgi:hypothetical protein
MQKQTNISHGVRWGTIIGFIYCLLLFLRYNQGARNPLLLGGFTFLGFIIVMVLILICGVQRKKQLGGYIELKDAFQTMFAAVICCEIFYTAFNFIYLKFIDPDFFQKVKDSMEVFMQKNHVEQSKIDDAISKIDVQSSRNMNLGTSFLSFAYGILLSGVFALIFALIIKKKREPFQNQGDNFVQS